MTGCKRSVFFNIDFGGEDMPALKNAKQEKFVQGLINGLNQRKAYRAAYPNALKWKDSSVDARASNLLKNDKLLARFEELQAKSEDKAIMSAIERKKWLTNAIMEEHKLNDKLKAIDILNKMTGEYIEKVELSGSVDTNPFSGLTTEELKKLIK